MSAPPLWGPIETPDGIVVPGPHGVSAESRVRPETSSTVSIVTDNGEAVVIDTGRRTAPEYPPGVFDTVCRELDSRELDWWPLLHLVVQIVVRAGFDNVGYVARDDVGEAVVVSGRVSGVVRRE